MNTFCKCQLHNASKDVFRPIFFFEFHVWVQKCNFGNFGDFSILAKCLWVCQIQDLGQLELKTEIFSKRTHKTSKIFFV